MRSAVPTAKPEVWIAYPPKVIRRRIMASSLFAAAVAGAAGIYAAGKIGYDMGYNAGKNCVIDTAAARYNTRGDETFGQYYRSGAANRCKP